MTVEDYTLVYLPGGTDLGDLTAPPAQGAALRALAEHPHLRAVLHVRTGRPFLALLRWPPGTDLGALDQRVVSQESAEEDFSTCVSAYVGTQRCRSCEHSTLCVLPDAGLPPSGPGRWAHHPIRRGCPHCGVESLSYLALAHPPVT